MLLRAYMVSNPPIALQTSGISREQRRIQIFPQKAQSDSEADRRASGHVFKSNPQLRAGMAKGADPRGAADVLSGFQVGGKQEK